MSKGNLRKHEKRLHFITKPVALFKLTKTQGISKVPSCLGNANYRSLNHLADAEFLAQEHRSEKPSVKAKPETPDV